MRRRKEQASTPAVQGPTPSEIGLYGTAEDFIQANVEARFKMNEYGSYVGYKDQQALQEGAFQAFLEGRPGNLQSMLADPDMFSMYFGAGGFVHIDCGNLLSKLIKDSDRPTAIITLALMKVPEQEKQEYLGNLLHRSVSDKYVDDELVAALLKAGAKADAELSGGFKGVILATAIENSRPEALVRLLYKAGAKFEDALFFMKAKKWDDKEIKALKDYRQKITGEVATVEVNPAFLLQMQQQIEDLTKRVKKLELPAQTAASRPKKTAAPAV